MTHAYGFIGLDQAQVDLVSVELLWHYRKSCLGLLAWLLLVLLKYFVYFHSLIFQTISYGRYHMTVTLGPYHYFLQDKMLILPNPEKYFGLWKSGEMWSNNFYNFNLLWRQLVASEKDCRIKIRGPCLP